MELKLTKLDGSTEVIEVAAFEDLTPVEEPTTEAIVEADFIALREKALKKNGEARIKIIQPGWGSSGYYPAEMLERDGPQVFRAGTKMFWDHPSRSEEADRPERSLRDLAAELTTDARYLANGPQGAGLYADAKVFDGFAPAVEQLAPHIGVSIRALGQAKAGQAEGRKGPIIEKLVKAASVDFVTEPGAGGKVVQLFESARGAIREESQVDEQEAKQLRESVDAMKTQMDALQESLKTTSEERDRLREGIVLSQSTAYVTEVVNASKLPDVTKERLAKRLSANPPVKEGELDKDAYKTAIEVAIAEEVDYLSKVSGSPIRGMNSDSSTQTSESMEADLESIFKGLGLSESMAKSAAIGRN